MFLTRVFRLIKKLLKGEKKIQIVLSNKKIFDYHGIYKCSGKNEKLGRIVGIDGIGWSGSSAVSDFLAEFSGCHVFGGVDPLENPDRGEEDSFECDFFRNPHSLLDLERICFTNVVRIHNQAIYDFIETVDDNYRYGPKILFHNEDYLYYTQIFLKNIIDYETILGGNPRYVVKKLSVEQYRAYAREYLQNIIKNLPYFDNLVFDQLFAIGNPDDKVIREYFSENALNIYVWRDPRDIYASARLYKGNGDWVPKNPDLFVKWYTHSFLQYFNHKSENLLLIRFEDLVINYDSVTKLIMNELNLSTDSHIKPKSYFNPSDSINNIGIYKKCLPDYKDEIEIIEQRLKQFCFYEEKEWMKK